MLKKTYRLSSVRIKSPKTINSESFSIKWTKNSLSYPRFGFVISKRIDSRAVVRNSLKRKLSGCIEEIFDKIEGGNDFVIYPKPKAVHTNRGEILKEMKKALAKKDPSND